MFVVALGPAALNLMQTFSGGKQPAQSVTRTRGQPRCGGDCPRFGVTGAGSLRSRPGDVAEWLGSGLQSRVHRFDSGRRLSVWRNGSTPSRDGAP